MDKTNSSSVRVRFSGIIIEHTITIEMTDNRCLQEIMIIYNQERTENIKKTFLNKHGSLNGFEITRELQKYMSIDDEIDDELKKTSPLYLKIISI